MMHISKMPLIKASFFISGMSVEGAAAIISKKMSDETMGNRFTISSAADAYIKNQRVLIPKVIASEAMTAGRYPKIK
jgi:hypothetical protein